MVQGGDPTGTGKGGDSMFGGKLPDEFHKDLRCVQCLHCFLLSPSAFLNDTDSTLSLLLLLSLGCFLICILDIYLLIIYGCRHDRRGVISMANNGRDTNGAQFFFTYSAQPHLNDQYSIIGQ